MMADDDPDDLEWQLTVDVDATRPGPYWKPAEWRRNYERAREFWSDGLASDFRHVWYGSRLPYARRREPVEDLAAELASWRAQNEATLTDTAYALVNLRVFEVTLRGIWGEDLAVIDVLAGTVEWNAADSHY